MIITKSKPFTKEEIMENLTLNLSAGFAQENKVDQYSGNYIERQCNRACCEELFNIYIHSPLLLSRKNTPVLNARIAGGRLAVNNSRYFNGSTDKKPGDTRSMPNQIEARLIERSANAPLNVALENNLTSYNVTNRQRLFNCSN